MILMYIFVILLQIIHFFLFFSLFQYVGRAFFPVKCRHHKRTEFSGVYFDKYRDLKKNKIQNTIILKIILILGWF